MNVLEVDNIELKFGKQQILNSIYVKVEKGKILGILGRNGCGKTSLLRIIFGELKPQNKLIRIDNKPLLKPLYKKGKCSYLTQFNLFPNSFTIKDCFYYYSIDLKEFLNQFNDFKKKINEQLYTFSGGERRLLEIYCMLNTASKIVLLDEPFSHLAPVYVEKIISILQKKKEEKIIVITDHLFEHSLTIADDLYLIKNGWSKKINKREDLIFYNYIRE